MRIRTVKPQIILIACLVIIHYLSAPSTRERESVCAVCTVCVCAVCVYCMCVYCMCACLSVCWATRQTHTSRCLHRHETFAKRHRLALSPTYTACLPFPIPLTLTLHHYICLFLFGTCSVCLSLAFN